MDPEVSVSNTDKTVPDMVFDDLLKLMEPKDQAREMPGNLPGGVLLDQSYVVSTTELNSVIFSSSSRFMQSMADRQGASDWQAEPWKLESNGESLRRVLTYTNPATKLVKAKATEEQVYLKADGKSFAVLLSVSIPDIPFGKCFKTEMLFCISPGTETPSKESCSRLVVSWRCDFLRSTVMKGMVEMSVRLGLKRNFALFAELLSQNVKPLVFQDAGSSKEQVSASLQQEEESPPLSFTEKMESSACSVVEDAKPIEEGKPNAPSLIDRVIPFFTGRNVEIARTSTKDIDHAVPHMAFDDLLKAMEAKDQEGELPANLPGGVVLDQSYAVSPSELNLLIFSPTSSFMQSLADRQGVTGWQAEPWKLENDGESLRRVLTYINPASKLVKAVKSTEEQVYLKADGKSFAVLLSVSIPDVPFGKCFKTEMLFCIFPGPEIPSKEPCSRLVISWRVNFVQSTMMKGMIENGARKGLNQNFALFAELLSLNVRPLVLKDAGSSKEQVSSPLPTEKESELKLAFRFLGNFSVVFSVVAGSFVMAHMLNPSKVQVLDFLGLDLPDSIGELVVSGVLFHQAERAFNMIRRYMHARKQRDPHI